MLKVVEDNIIGFYASFNSDGIEQEQIKAYLWGDDGLKNKLNSLKWQTYGKDLHLILFRVYVNPIPHLRFALREIENYKTKEKAIGIPVILDKDNFFNLDESNRQKFFKTIMLRKLELLQKKIKRNKLDLNIEKLKSDVDRLLNGD